MPEVRVVFNGEKIPEEVRLSLKTLLPKIVAAALHVEEIKDLHLTRGNIGVEFKAAGPDDVLTHDLQVRISANDCPERSAKRQEAAEQILRRISPLIPPLRTFYVWITLFPAAFVEA